jgi:hypothetical protein
MVQDRGGAVDLTVVRGIVRPGGRWNGECIAGLFAHAFPVWQLRRKCELAPKARRLYACAKPFIITNAASPQSRMGCLMHDRGRDEFGR